MGGDQSTPEEPLEFTSGYRVISIHSGSPCDHAELDVFFDFIVEANGVPLDLENDSFMSIIQSSLNQKMRLTVYSTKTSSMRDVVIEPRQGWGGPGTLGATIRFERVSSPDQHAWHVLDIHPGSPAEVAGLIPHTDYVLSAVELVFKDEGDLEYVLSSCLNTEVAFYVYNSTDDTVRQVSIVPDPNWGGEGSLGCDIGRGILHRLPFETRRGHARLLKCKAQPTHSPGLSAPGQPTGAPQRGRETLSQPVDAVAKVNSASTAVQRRAAAAVLGSFVADAATMGLHWIYDMAELQRRLELHAASPEFHEPPACPYYQYPSGSLSPYGDQAFVLLQSIAEQTELQPVAFANALLRWSQGYKGFVDHATAGFQTRMLEGKHWPECGAEDKQANCLGKVPSVVARYAGSGDLVARISEAVRVHQDHPDAVRFAVAGTATMLSRVWLNVS